MLKISNWLFLLSTIILISCNGNNKEKEKLKESEIESLKTEVIGVHDEVMPKMDKIMQLKAKLNQNIEEISDSTSSDSLVIVRNLLNDLEVADASMMVWMRNYDPMMDDMSHEEKLLYLEEKNKEIQLVRQQMLSAIAQSEEFLAEKEKTPN